MVSHEEARAIKITKVAYRLMAALWEILEEKEAYTDTKRANVEWKKTLADSCSEQIGPPQIFRILHNIKLLLTKVLASKRVEMQACFARLYAKTKTIVNKMIVDMKNLCDIQQRIFNTNTRALVQKVSKEHFQRKSEREVDKECDVVLVPLDGGRLSAEVELDGFDCL
ncbi:hypothetical protein CTI12_AA146050 [Artemisia annua]|uniref:Uncharacterized protein n=1 Tax=Artemisia annua TaxID=35608 RepID=A0A2U1PJL4_ARTAN|nr:hypothetical protein CTI12_AA146050 [Artemisia annua]